MTFVPKVKCDVFVSYATANNQQFSEAKPGWVTSLRDALKIALDESLRRPVVGAVLGNGNRSDRRT